MAKALGLKSEGGNAFLKTISRKGIGSKIPDFLWEKIKNPLVFKPLNGDPAHGYATFYQTHKRLLKEDRQPHKHALTLLRSL